MARKPPQAIVGRVVAITGGARGIGRATAQALIAQGARVAIGDIDAPLAQRTAQELGAGTLGLALDVTDRASFEGFLTEVEAQLGPLDVLINNAGIMRNLKLREDRTPIDVTREIDIDLSGPIRMVQQFLPHLLERPEAMIVNVSSGLAFVPFPAAPVYSAAKAGLRAYTMALRAQLKGMRVRPMLCFPRRSMARAIHSSKSSVDLGSGSIGPHT